MAAEIDVLARALADVNVVARSEFKLKPEQEVAVKSLLDGKDVLALLPTGYGKSLIHQMFVRAKDFEMNGKATILVISPLASIIKDQILNMKSIGYSAVDSREMTMSEIRKCNFKVLYATAEKVKEKAFREMLIDPNSPLNQNICTFVIDKSHTVETWTGKRCFLVLFICICFYLIAKFQRDQGEKCNFNIILHVNAKSFYPWVTLQSRYINILVSNF